MGNCCGNTHTTPSLPAPAPVLFQHGTEMSPVLSSQPSSRARTRTAPWSELTHRSGISSQGSNTRNRTKSEPQPPQFSRSSSSRNPSTRAKSVAGLKISNCSDFGLAVPVQSQPGAHSPTMNYPAHRSLTSTVRQVHIDYPEFRILVVGKRGSGKSSLVNATFRVDMLAAPESPSDIDFAHRPNDNHYLVVHEFSGLEPGDAQGLQAIRDFISNHTDPNRLASERLHAIWICVPVSEALDGSIGEGVEEILGMRRENPVPVIVAFTKSDMAFPQISGTETSRAYAQCERLCRPLFRKGPKDVPAELVSVVPQFGALINNLILTTNRLIMGSRTASNPSARSSSQGSKPQIPPIPLARDVALRASRAIQTSIENGRNRYWRNLWSSLYFADQSLKNCVNLIHNDIVKIWVSDNRNGYLLSSQFKIDMSHIVKDLAVPAGGTSQGPDWNGSADKFANWVYDKYQGSEENVRCMMGYIVNLTVILDGIFWTDASNATATGNAAPNVMGTHIKSGRRDSIHLGIRSFVTETFPIRFAVQQNDSILETIIDLIRQYCVLP